jgi:predicted carbohydrate-binding protein with CBM48
MSSDSRDPAVLWPRIESALRRRPDVSAAAIDRVMSRVRVARLEPAKAPTRQHGVRRATHWFTEQRFIAVSPLQLLAASLVLAAGLYALAGFRSDAASSGVPQSPGVQTQAFAAGYRPEDAARPVQFVFVAKDARQVTIAGDFNDWNPTAAPLHRAGAEGVWSIVLPLAPGRHLYSFVVDGRRWVPDAEAPRAPETEFGESSVILVERGS